MIIILLLTLIASAIAAAAYFKKECQLTKKELQEWRDKFTNKYQDNA